MANLSIRMEGVLLGYSGATESGSVPDLRIDNETRQLEKDFLHSDPGRQAFYCRFVRAGIPRSAGERAGLIEILPDALQLAVLKGLFDGRAVFVDHPGNSTNGPSLHNLVGVTAGAIWNPNDQAVEGVIRLYSNATPFAKLLEEILEEGSDAPDVGLSIVFWPVFDRRQPLSGPRLIVGIRHVESVDLVFEPAADGRLLQALSACSISNRPVQDRSFSGGVPMNEIKENMIQQVEEFETAEREIVGQSSSEQPGPLSPKIDEKSANPANQAEAHQWLAALSRATGEALIHASGLPEVSKQHLLEQTFGTPQQVSDAIQKERQYLGKLAADGIVRLGGQAPRGSQVQLGLSSLDRFSLALDALLAGKGPGEGIPPLSGIREAYIQLSGDYEMTGVFNPERISLANVNSSTMAGMVANVLNKAVVNAFQQYPRWWERIVVSEDFSNLQQVKWVTLGGVGELPTVGEGASYSELTWDDQTETASFVKKGGYLGITLESIDKDDTRRLQAAPRALAQAAWLTLSKTISAIFTDNSGVGPTMSDSQALFHTNHGNLGTTALSISSYVAARTAMRKQTELNSGERLGALTAPKYLLVPPDLEITALQVLGSDLDYSYALSNGVAAPVNPLVDDGSSRAARMQFARDRVIVVDLWTDTNNWAAVADPLMYPSIGLGFRYGRSPALRQA